MTKQIKVTTVEVNQTMRNGHLTARGEHWTWELNLSRHDNYKILKLKNDIENNTN